MLEKKNQKKKESCAKENKEKKIEKKRFVGDKKYICLEKKEKEK